MTTTARRADVQMLIARDTLRDQAVNVLRDLILHGELPPGSRVNETRLAAELGISRSPLREALGHLANDGFLRSEPGRGYFVCRLTTDEARELYPILACLEQLAVHAAGVPHAETLLALERINEDLCQCLGDPSAAVHKNFEWHTKLVENCPNRRLRSMLALQRQQIYRYEYAYYRPGAARLDESTSFHRTIIRALRDGDEAEVLHAIDRHWLSDLDFVTPRIESYPLEDGGSRR